MKEASATDASLVAAASLEMVSFCIRSSRTLMDWAFSEGMLSEFPVICFDGIRLWVVGEAGIVVGI